MRILYLTYDGLTDALGQSQITPYLTGCSGEHLITIISFEKEAAFAKNQSVVRKELDEAGIHWIPMVYTKKPPVLSTLKDIWRMRKTASKVLNKTKTDLVHCRSYVSAFTAFKLKEKYSVKVLFDMRGFWADERIDGRIWSRSNPIMNRVYKKLKKLEKQWLISADAVISLTDTGKDEILEHIQPNVSPDQITVIPCCADENLFNPEEISSSKREEYKKILGLRNTEMSLCYLGSVGTWYLAEEMLRKFKALFERGLVQKFVWLTNESEDFILKRAEQFNLPKDSLIIKSSERHEVPRYLSAIDIGIFYIRDAYSKKASSPTKLGELLLMGKPVICNPIGDLASIFSENKIGICRNPDEEISDQDFKDLLAVRSGEIRKVGLRRFALRSGVEKYLSVYKKLNENS